MPDQEHLKWILWFQDQVHRSCHWTSMFLKSECNNKCQAFKERGHSYPYEVIKLRAWKELHRSWKDVMDQHDNDAASAAQHSVSLIG